MEGEWDAPARGVPVSGAASASVLEGTARAFVLAQRVARLATADEAGAPHVVPVCFALDGAALYVAIDEKPKGTGPAGMKRLRNIAANPRAAVVVDRYAEDWSRLAWVMLRGRAEVLAPGEAEHAAALSLLRARYPQYRAMRLDDLPVIALRIARATWWGDLAPNGA
ncbi:MAG: TIGR03668 family PPOX class F420-dependent oxidoreductase [Proteobacteria bacterium]|nr:TIGR03668 family PPOX class F420-dependent oxidoreductase [Pseudomonadota bacterium]